MTRDDIQTLLPFLANDTLTGDERADVEAEVAKDADLQAELAALRAIRDTMQAEDHESPGEFGLARLMRDAEGAAQAPVAANSPSRPILWQIAAAILLAVVLGQAFITSRSGEPGFELAGGDAAFEITLEADATEAEIRALLLDAGVEIVSGPTEMGAYQLAPLGGVSEADAAATLAASDLIESLSTPDE